MNKDFKFIIHIAKKFDYLLYKYLLIILVFQSTLNTGCGSSVKYAAEGGRDKSEGSITGMASFYAEKFHGRPTASGEKYDMYGYTAAHRALNFGTRVKVTNLANGRSVVVRINDRGPFRGNRIIDLSYQAAQEIGMINSGVARVKIDILD